MSNKRKTINVKFMLDNANDQLSRTDDFATPEFKKGIVAMIERILLTSDNYNGFRFLNNSDTEFGTNGYYTRIYN